MNQSRQSIDCPTPNCGGKIEIDTYLLLSGAKFSCPVCLTTLGLSNESKETVSTTMEKFEALKAQVGNVKPS